MIENQNHPAREFTASRSQFQTRPPHRVLVVEDDCDIRHFNVGVLSRHGYQVDAAQDGAAAWDAIQLNSYDLMVTDNNMPNLSGLELLKKIHSARIMLPAIMATGTLPQAEFTRQPWLQPAAVLLKPYTAGELLGTVRNILHEADVTATVSHRLTSGDLTENNVAQAAAPLAAARECPTNIPHRILVVDNDNDLRSLYTEALIDPGYHVDVVEDGAAAWGALQASNYNLLITEHDLPKLTGVALVRKMRAAHMALPVMMAATTLPFYELDRDPSLQLAATLSKPFTLDEFLTTVKHVLRVTPGPREQTEPAPNHQYESAGGSLRF